MPSDLQVGSLPARLRAKKFLMENEPLQFKGIKIYNQLKNYAENFLDVKYSAHKSYQVY